MRFVNRCYAIMLCLLMPWIVSAAEEPAAGPNEKASEKAAVMIERAPAPRLYGSLDYLCWWLKPAPLSVPLVSTGPISTTHHGWLDNSDAIILYVAPYYPAQGGDDSQ